MQSLGGGGGEQVTPQGLASSPGRLRGGEKAWYTLRMLRYPKNLRISDSIIYFSAHKSAYVSVFYSLLLDTCPLNHSDSVIRLQVNQFREISSPMCPSNDREGILKRTD